MKTIITAVALATLIASPALAAKKNQNRHVSAQAYAQSQQVQTQRYSTNPSFNVYRNGQYVGSDPDALIRQQLLREEDDDE